jgi:hypothetical protein
MLTKKNYCCGTAFLVFGGLGLIVLGGLSALGKMYYEVTRTQMGNWDYVIITIGALMLIIGLLYDQIKFF